MTTNATTPQPAAELSDAQIEGALDALVAEGETVRWYLEQAFSGDDTVVRDIMVREVARTILAAATPQPQALPELPKPAPSQTVQPTSHLPKYTKEMGKAAERYLFRTNRSAHPLPDQFRWEECFRLMLERRECDMCSGHGLVGSHMRDGSFDGQQCPACEGSGITPAAATAPTLSASAGDGAQSPAGQEPR